MKDATIRDLRISKDVRKKTNYDKPLFKTGEAVIEAHRNADEFSFLLTSSYKPQTYSSLSIYLIGTLHSAYQDVITFFLGKTQIDIFNLYIKECSNNSKQNRKNINLNVVLKNYDKNFPTKVIKNYMPREVMRGLFVHSIIKENKAIEYSGGALFSANNFDYSLFVKNFKKSFIEFESDKCSECKKEELDEFISKDLYNFLIEPQTLFPDSLEKQIEYILTNWKKFLTENVLGMLLKSQDYIKEFYKVHFVGKGKPQFKLTDLEGIEAYTEDKDWMPNVVMMAKNTLVWLSQLSKKYNREIRYLSDIPNDELDFLKESGFNALWLIGIWERSPASKKIKRLCGNPDAESSAYSLYDYRISDVLGGNDALQNLKERMKVRGLRLAGDMVPNHTGLDSPWVLEHPEYFISQTYPPFASYTYNGEDLSNNNAIEIKIEDHYYNKTDCAVTFMRRDKNTGDVRFIFHGNDGTSMPWNDTAQLDYLNKDVREAVIGVILRVARDFPIIRFDAAMTLAMRHIRRLWYPHPGGAGDIPGRADHSMSDEEFASRMGEEFWKTVVDRVQQEAPDTLLLAEAFWMMEGYFVRSLGLHRVYNSAFMNMLRNEANKEYRDGIKETLAFDPEIMQRYVNFLNNPDEDAAIVGFGDGDKYFGCATLLSTLPGLPMFGHGQLEGYSEKYGMEFSSPKWDESPNFGLLNAHKKLIFPLLRKRRCFSGTAHFEFFDLQNGKGTVEENVFAYANGSGKDRVFVFYNNSYSKANGKVNYSVEKNTKENGNKTLKSISFIEALGLESGEKNFMLYQTLNDSLYHIRPVDKIKNEGFWVNLNGFQTMVLENITTVYDTHNIYKKFYDVYGDMGVVDINEASEDLLFSNLYKEIGNLTEQDFFDSVHTLLYKDSPKALKVLLEKLTFAYQKMYKVSESGGFSIKAESIDDILTEEYVKGIFKTFAATRKKTPALLETAFSIIPNSTELLATILFVLPYINTVNSDDELNLLIRGALRFYTFRFMDKFGSVDKKAMERVKWYSYLIIKSIYLPLNADELLKNRVFCDIIKLNEYNGVLYYDSGRYKEISVLLTISQLMFNARSDKEIIKVVDFLTLLYRIEENTQYQYNKIKENLNNYHKSLEE